MEVFKELAELTEKAYENRYIDTHSRERNKLRLYVLTGMIVTPNMDVSFTREVIGLFSTMRKAQKELERWENGFKNRYYTKCCDNPLFLKKVSGNVIMEEMPKKAFDKCPYCDISPLILIDYKEYESLDIRRINLNESKFREITKDKLI